MNVFPEIVENEEQLEEIISRPSARTADLFSQLDGDMLVLGVAGKIGPSLCLMMKRACVQAGVQKKILGVSRFGDVQLKKHLVKSGIEIIQGDLLEGDFLKKLPKVKNVFFLAGMKFGSEQNLAQTWAVNAYLPAMVAESFKNSNIVAYSTGCVYPLVDIKSGGSKETDKPEPVGEYAQSCLGRERMFEFGSHKHGTRVSAIRLNYAVELRYGVLVDIALKVKNRIPVDLSMGYFNVIWQGDANNMVLQSLQFADSPPKILNITGKEILSVREVALEFGKLFKRQPEFIGEESETALLSNPQQAMQMLENPAVSIQQVIKWTAEWLTRNKTILNKPTHFEVRDGKY